MRQGGVGVGEGEGGQGQQDVGEAEGSLCEEEGGEGGRLGGAAADTGASFIVSVWLINARAHLDYIYRAFSELAPRGQQFLILRIERGKVRTSRYCRLLYAVFTARVNEAGMFASCQSKTYGR